MHNKSKKHLPFQKKFIYPVDLVPSCPPPSLSRSYLPPSLYRPTLLRPFRTCHSPGQAGSSLALPLRLAIAATANGNAPHINRLRVQFLRQTSILEIELNVMSCQTYETYLSGKLAERLLRQSVPLPTPVSTARERKREREREREKDLLSDR
jgi:hypothetical protein